ncbi:MAG: DUF1385 domain-containing protein [Fimbriimonadaceae bacterium]|nr:DUF1385 domain-containing protein [Fimbriimonadaceae bacterium]
MPNPEFTADDRSQRTPFGQDPFTAPVGRLAQPIVALNASDSIERAASRLSQSALPAIPVVEDGRYCGVFGQRAILARLGEGTEPFLPIKEFVQVGVTVPSTASGAAALREFDDRGTEFMVVLDGEGAVVGVLTPADLASPTVRQPRPRAIGGMATPFGVYLTNGSVRAGAGDLALMSTGALLFTILAGAAIATDLLVPWLSDRGLPEPAIPYFVDLAPLVVFLVAMRAMPLAGIHAAEHQVVHAIERGERLVPAIVRRMPRVHPRCGTNFAVGISLFLALAGWTFVPEPRLRLILAAAATLLLWRPVGGLFQYWVTTRPPSDKHLAMGIRSGEELLEILRTQADQRTTIPRRILASGMLQVMAGALIVYGIVSLVAHLLGYPLQ